jgi:carbon-monoxide dehydrogenase small subunit
MKISIELDGSETAFDVEPRTLLGQLLRDQGGVSGIRLDCETSTCGACTVLLDGEPIKSCAMLGVMADGERITTAAGLGSGPEAVVTSVLDSDDLLPCGECRQAMQLVAAALVRAQPQATRAEIARALSGTICRCTGYQTVVDAIKTAIDGARA